MFPCCPVFLSANHCPLSCCPLVPSPHSDGLPPSFSFTSILMGVWQKKTDLSVLSTVFTHACPCLNFSLSLEWLGKGSHLPCQQALCAGLQSSIVSCLHEVSSVKAHVPRVSDSPVPHSQFLLQLWRRESVSIIPDMFVSHIPLFHLSKPVTMPACECCPSRILLLFKLPVHHLIYIRFTGKK